MGGFKNIGRVLTKRERRKAGEDMETASCRRRRRRRMHVSAETQKSI